MICYTSFKMNQHTDAYVISSNTPTPETAYLYRSGMSVHVSDDELDNDCVKKMLLDVFVERRDIINILIFKPCKPSHFDQMMMNLNSDEIIAALKTS